MIKDPSQVRLGQKNFKSSSKHHITNQMSAEPYTPAQQNVQSSVGALKKTYQTATIIMHFTWWSHDNWLTSIIIFLLAFNLIIFTYKFSLRVHQKVLKLHYIFWLRSSSQPRGPKYNPLAIHDPNLIILGNRHGWILQQSMIAFSKTYSLLSVSHWA